MNGLNATSPTTTLVVYALYQFTRNPIYFGFVGFDSAACGNCITLSTRTLSAKSSTGSREFGEEYLRYKVGLRRWM